MGHLTGTVDMKYLLLYLLQASPCLGKVILKQQGFALKIIIGVGESSVRVDNMPSEQWDFFGQKDKQNVGWHCHQSEFSLLGDELMN